MNMETDGMATLRRHRHSRSFHQLCHFRVPALKWAQLRSFSFDNISAQLLMTAYFVLTVIHRELESIKQTYCTVTVTVVVAVMDEFDASVPVTVNT
jgi:hypothetical protein